MKKSELRQIIKEMILQETVAQATVYVEYIEDDKKLELAILKANRDFDDWSWSVDLGENSDKFVNEFQKKTERLYVDIINQFEESIDDILYKLKKKHKV